MTTTFAVKNLSTFKAWFGNYIQETLYDSDNRCWFVTVKTIASDEIKCLIRKGVIETAPVSIL